MRTNVVSRFCLIGAVLSVCASRGCGEEIEGSLSVVGNRVTVQALREDRSPANEAVVRIAKAGQVIAEGRINHQGFWLTEVAKAGAYEVWLGDPAKEDDLLRIPISIAADAPPESASGRPPCCVGPFLSAWTERASAAREIPWLPALSGLSLLASSVVLYVRFRHGTKAIASE